MTTTKTTQGRELLPYGRQSIDDDDVEAVVAQLKSVWLTQGPTVAKFEEALTEITGARYAVAVANGTAALHLASIAAGVRPGDTGLTSDITFVASANGIRYAGGVPRLVDVDPETALVRIDRLSEAADALAAEGRPPRVLVPVSFAGSPPDLAAVQAIAKKHGARVIEDAAHSLGATYTVGDASVRSASCTHSDMAILSFHPVKHIATGEGGAITTNDEGLYRELLDLRTHGITRDPKLLARAQTTDGPWYYEQRTLGWNYRLTDVQCALGLSQAKKFPRFLARRRALAARYDAALARPGLVERYAPLAVPGGVMSAYHLYVVRLRPHPGEALSDIAARRLALYTRLREANVLPQVHYIPVHRQPDFIDSGLAGGAFPGADAYYASCLSLPLFPAMGDDDVDYVLDVLAQA
jgi:UDP-4-amino-4,6-dideoxy-N-acetyl-beta-L-altrosamine transaminase